MSKKRAWRKNDIADLEQGLADARETDIVFGPGPLLSQDTKGDLSWMSERMKQEKQLKSHEILAARSAVPPLKSGHKKKEKPKTKVKELVKMSGKLGNSTYLAQLERDGFVKSATNDLWGEQTNRPTAKQTNRPTAKPQPVLNEAAVEIPDAGKSYNPDINEWKALIIKENEKLEKLEARERQLEAQRQRIEEIIREADESEEESSEQESQDDAPISVNPPAKNKKKTKQQLNKRKRHLERQRIHAELKQLKQQLHEIRSLGKAPPAAPAQAPHEKKVAARRRNAVMPEMLEVKLSDELDTPLRLLKPEGSVSKDRFRSLQARGLVEARTPAKRRRRNKMRSVEKWSFKDFDKTRSV